MIVARARVQTRRAPADGIPILRPYQREAARAIVESVMQRSGRSISVEIARQGGKNELSAQVEMLLLAAFASRQIEAVKCAPTYRPLLRISMLRLWSRLHRAGLRGASSMRGDAISVGDARIVFLSAEPAANVVGHTAGLLLEVDEAQDVDADKFDREFRPMAATTNATTVYYGTAWDGSTLLERAKQAHLEAERRDGVRRHFEYDWQAVAAHNPAYAAFVESELLRLGETHPTFLTQYCLKTISGGGRLLSASQRAQLAGTHARQSQPVAGEAYVVGLDLAGGDDAIDPTTRGAGFQPASSHGDRTGGAPVPHAQRDSTVLTIGRLIYGTDIALADEPRVEIVEHCAWTGERHETLLPRLLDLLRDVWRVHRVAVDATGLGETAARLLASAMGESRVLPVKFTSESKSRLGFGLLAAINGGRLKSYRGDGSAEHREFHRQCELARVAYRANRTMNFFVDPSEGHDDYVISAALLVEASKRQVRRAARGRGTVEVQRRKSEVVAW